MTVNNNKDISISKSSISSYRDRASENYASFAIKRKNILGVLLQSPLTHPWWRHIWPKYPFGQIEIVKMNNFFMTYVNISIVQKIYAKNISPFLVPYLKGQPLFLGIDGKVLSDRDRQDEQFFFYDLCQQINGSTDICQKCQPLLGPLFKGPDPISWYRSKGFVISNIFCSISDHKFWTVFDTF